MKVLIAAGLYAPEIGGPATHVAMLEAVFPTLDVEIVVYPFSRVRRYPKLIRHVMYCIGLIRRARHADVIYALDPVSVGLPALYASRIARKPLVLRVGGDYAWEQATQRFGMNISLDDFLEMKHKPFGVRILERIQRKVARGAVRVIAPSEYLRRVITTWGIASGKITTVYNAFEPTDVSDAKAVIRERLGFRGTVLVSAGRLVPWKGFRVLIDVVSALRNGGLDVMAAIAGDGPEEAALRKHAREVGVAEHIHFLGRLPHDELQSAIAGADIFVLNTGYEGLSHLLLEVMALGMPIVTTPVGGNTELITDGTHGILVLHDHQQAFVDALRRLIQDPEEALRLGAAARAHVRSFTPERMAAEVREVLATAL